MAQNKQGDDKKNSNDKTNNTAETLTRANTKLWTILQDGCIKVMKDARSVYKGPNKVDYRHEQATIRTMYQPIMWGIGCTFLSFASFRLGSSRWMQHYRKTGSILGFGKTKTIQPTSVPKQHPPSLLERKQLEQKEALEKALSLPTDLALSLLIGVSVGFFLTDRDLVEKDLQRIPLQPGKSLVSQHICPALVQAYNELDVTIQKDPSLSMFSTLVQNCKKRQEYETRLLKQPLDTTEPHSPGKVSIPYPGIPN